METIKEKIEAKNVSLNDNTRKWFISNLLCRIGTGDKYDAEEIKNWINQVFDRHSESTAPPVVDKTVEECFKNATFGYEVLKGVHSRDGKPGDMYERMLNAITDYASLKVEQAVEVALKIASDKSAVKGMPNVEGGYLKVVDKQSILSNRFLCLTLLAIEGICLAGCERRTETYSEPKKIQSQNTWDQYNVIVIDGCEYLELFYDRSKSITHKGNCKNPIHKK